MEQPGHDRRRLLALPLAIGAASLASACASASRKRKDAEEDIGPAEDLMREHGVLNRMLLVDEECVRRLKRYHYAFKRLHQIFIARLTAEPIRDAHFLDPNATKETRRYWIVAVDVLGQEGYPSAPTWHERQFKKYYEPYTKAWHQ